VITKRRVVISVILAATLSVFVYSFSLTRSENAPVVFKNSAVVAVSPEPAALVLRQSSISISLAPGYSLAQENTDGLSISVSGLTTGIPEDEIQVLSTENEYTFLPGAGKQFSLLPLGRVCSIAEIERTAVVDAAPTAFSWCFSTQ
jgi:hypothetical protein